MTRTGIIILATNFFTYLCYAVGIFLLSDKKNGWAVSALRSFLYLAIIVGLCFFAIINRWKNFYWFINYFEFFLFIFFLCVDSKGIFFRNVFLASIFESFFMLTVFPCKIIADNVPAPASYFLYSLTRLFFFTALFVFWKKMGRGAFVRATENITNARWGFLCIFALTAVLSTKFTISHLLILNFKTTFWDYIISLGVMLSVVAAYIVIIKMMGFLNEESENRILKEREKILRMELEAEQKFIALSKQNRHDMRHHAHLILDLLEKGDVGAAQEYLGQYEKVLEENALNDFCENVIANAMLRRAYGSAKKMGISFTCQTQIPKKINLSDTETCVLFGNLLENAIEAAAKCKEPYIKVRSKINEGRLYLSVKNSVEARVSFKDGIPLSTKKGGGLGIRSALGVLQKNGGMANFVQRKGEFEAQIILGL